MSEFSKFKIKGTIYNVKDEVARQNINSITTSFPNNYLKLDGTNLITGSIKIGNNFYIDEVTAPTNTKNKEVVFVDPNYYAVSWMRSSHDINNNFSFTINQRRKINESFYDTNLILLVDPTGKRYASLNSDLIISKSNNENRIKLKRTDYQQNVTSISDRLWFGAVYGVDNNESVAGYIGFACDSDHTSVTKLLARSSSDNYLELTSSPNGTKNINFSNPELWRAKLFPNNIKNTATHILAITDNYTSGGYISKSDLFNWMGAGITANGDSIANCCYYRNNIASNGTLIMTEGNLQRSALLIFANSSGAECPKIMYRDRWGNNHPVIDNSNITLTFTWTGEVNTLGTFSIKNTTNGYIQMIVIYPAGVFTAFTV